MFAKTIKILIVIYMKTIVIGENLTFFWQQNKKKSEITKAN